MPSPELLETALRVLTRWTEGLPPAPADAEVLRRNGCPEEAALEMDELACHIVARESRQRAICEPHDETTGRAASTSGARPGPASA